MSGAVTAISAIDAGAHLLVIEKEAKDVEGQPWNQTNNTRICYSAFMNFNSEVVARAYLKRISMGRTPDDVIDSWAKFACKAVEWIQGIGTDPWDQGNTTEYPQTILPEAFETYSQWAFRGQGPELWEGLDKACQERSVEVLFETPGKRLLRNADGIIIGVEAEQDGKPFFIKAIKAVVLSTGGFEYNEEMLKQFIWAYPTRYYASLRPPATVSEWPRRSAPTSGTCR